MDWLDLLAVQETLKSLLQHHSSKASILHCSAFFIVQLSHPYMTTGKTFALTRWTFVSQVMSLLFNMLSRLVIAFQGYQTSPFQRKSILNIHWQDWCWSWNSNTLATWFENWLIGKDPDAGKNWRREEKGTTEDEMVGWHHRLDGHEFEQAPGAGDGQGSLACHSPWVCKDSDTTERLNWIDLNVSCWQIL